MAETHTKAENHLHPYEARWFAVLTRYRCEKSVQRLLSAKGITCYLPLQAHTRQYQRKVKVVHLPLISRYVFIKIVKQEYIAVLETPDVMQLVRFRRNIIAIPEAEMETMRRVVGETKQACIVPTSWPIGVAVEVVGGQLTGLSGVLVEQKSAHNLVVSLSTLGMDMLLQVEPKWLRVVEEVVAVGD